MMHKGYLRVSVCMYVYIYIYIYMCVCVCVSVSMYTYISIHVYIHVRKVVSTNMSRLTYALREGGREGEGGSEGGRSVGRKEAQGQLAGQCARRRGKAAGYVQWFSTVGANFQAKKLLTLRLHEVRNWGVPSRFELARPEERACERERERERGKPTVL